MNSVTKRIANSQGSSPLFIWVLLQKGFACPASSATVQICAAESGAGFAGTNTESKIRTREIKPLERLAANRPSTFVTVLPESEKILEPQLSSQCKSAHKSWKGWRNQHTVPCKMIHPCQFRTTPLSRVRLERPAQEEFA